MTHIAKVPRGILLALISIAVSGTLFAAAAPAQTTVTVHFADLNLSESGGVATLYHRIQVAADTLCGPRDLWASQLETRAYFDCVNGVMDRAVATVARPALSVYHRSHIKRSPTTH